MDCHWTNHVTSHVTVNTDIFMTRFKRQKQLQPTQLTSTQPTPAFGVSRIESRATQLENTKSGQRRRSEKEMVNSMKIQSSQETKTDYSGHYRS